MSEIKSKENDTNYDNSNSIVYRSDLPIMFELPAPDNVLDCVNCSDTKTGFAHQLMHHRGKKDDHGDCMMGELFGEKCPCPGFEANG